MSWRDEPMTKGEVYDALIEGAEQIEARVHTLPKKMPGLAWAAHRKMAEMGGRMASIALRNIAEGLKK